MTVSGCGMLYVLKPHEWDFPLRSVAVWLYILSLGNYH